MDHPTLDSDLILKTLLKTNRPPTDEEKAIIHEAMGSAKEKLEDLKAQISDALAHIKAFQSQVHQAVIKLERLQKEKATISDTAEDHRRVLSTIRNIPADVLREILIACVEDRIPVLSYDIIPLPYKLAQISSGLRRIALNTPIIWARMDVPFHCFKDTIKHQAYSIMASKATQWFERAGELPLTLSIEDPTANRYINRGDDISDPSHVLFDALLKFSARWKEIEFTSTCHYASKPVVQISALNATDLPLLQCVSLNLKYANIYSTLSSIGFLTIPTLNRLSLETNNIRKFEINWAVLTSFSLGRLQDSSMRYSRNDVAAILQQTGRLMFCDVVVNSNHRIGERYVEKITLPFLKTLHISESKFGKPSSRAPSLLDLITAPALETLCIGVTFLRPSLSDFLQRSPGILKLSLPYLREDVSLIDTTGLLSHCPSLTVLSLSSCYWEPGTERPPKWDANTLLRAFVEGRDVGVTCPHLQHIKCMGVIDFSLETLQLFLNGKHGAISTGNNILPWKKVIIDISNVKANKRTRQQMLEFISLKKAEGLDVDTSFTSDIRRRDRIFD